MISLPEFRALVQAELAPMLGATLEPNTKPSTAAQSTVALCGPGRILLKLDPAWDERLVLTRGQKFVPDELSLAERFVDVVAAIDAIDAKEFTAELLSGVPRRVVAGCVSDSGLLAAVLNQYEKWASYTYEGGRITYCICIDPAATPALPRLALSEVWGEEFAPVLSNGFDTLTVCNADGWIARFEQLHAGPDCQHAPQRLARIATYSVDGRVTATLNRHGEVLVFADGKLRFARRAATWTHYLHDVLVRRMSPPQDVALRWAIYESCLDVSFARCGGCIGVVRSGALLEAEGLVSEADLIAKQASVKSRLFAATIGAPFQKLDRRLRQEMLALDGVTVLDCRGSVLAVGAIISVPAGSVGGGRRAAAVRLSTVGLGIKISEDGKITAFSDERELFSF